MEERGKKVTICGLDFVNVELTDAEKQEPMSVERILEIEELMCANIFEDFKLFEIKVFNGYMMCKYPEHAKNIIKYSNMNRNMRTVLGGDSINIRLVMQALCDFVNLTTNSLARFNQIYHNVTKKMSIDISEANLAIFWHADWDDEYSTANNEDIKTPVDTWGGYLTTLVLDENHTEDGFAHTYRGCGDIFHIFKCTESEKEEVIKKMKLFSEVYECNFGYEIFNDISSSCTEEIYSECFHILDERLNIEENKITYIETAFD